MITHHPTDMTLAAFAAGTLDEGRSLVVSTHLAGCLACRKVARSFEHLGGVALEEAEPAPLRPDALQRALDAISPDKQTFTERGRDDAALPPPISAYSQVPWRWIGPGVYWHAVEVSKAQATRVFMLKAAPGTRLPPHKHAGIEWTCILQGAFRHQHGRFGAGDFDEADETVEHDPVVEDGVDCICLVAMQGQIQLKSRIGRLIQPFFRL